MDYREFVDLLHEQRAFNFSSDMRIPEELASLELIFFTSSGSTGEPKLIAHSKSAFLDACKKTNQHFGISASDVYGISLRWGYIARALVFGRVLQSGCKLIEFEGKWNPKAFCEFLEAGKVTVVSLVPAQLYDLVNEQLSPPKTLRLTFVSGGLLSEEIDLLARRLGWPVIETFGTTETCGMIAKKVESEFRIFADVQVKQVEGKLAVRGNQVAKYVVNHGQIQTVSDWLVLDDLIELTENGFRWIGRANRTIKIKGHSVNVSKIEALVRDCGTSVSVDFSPDERCSNVLILKSTNADQAKLAKEKIEISTPYLKGAIRIKIVDFIK